jgi:hypothetical protein
LKGKIPYYAPLGYQPKQQFYGVPRYTEEPQYHAQVPPGFMLVPQQPQVPPGYMLVPEPQPEAKAPKSKATADLKLDLSTIDSPQKSPYKVPNTTRAHKAIKLVKQSAPERQ